MSEKKVIGSLLVIINLLAAFVALAAVPVEMLLGLKHGGALRACYRNFDRIQSRFWLDLP